MKIGVVGTGNMGRSLGILLAEQGHQVFFGARDREKAAAAASLAGASAQSGGNQEAASFGEVLIWGVRGVAASEVVPDLAAVAGKVVIDMNNNETRVDGGVAPRPETPSAKSSRRNFKARMSSRPSTHSRWRSLK